jgi:hypothetical protein
VLTTAICFALGARRRRAAAPGFHPNMASWAVLLAGGFAVFGPENRGSEGKLGSE